ncbi:MAG: Type 1 glutamine amidotransferase-like domain-containing protein [Deltaproteobacteria bacterium]|nr:MAG: Type 1 glutamine amidotransferase-like domain-containing protein [Deltaproteobacteria bacterium]
MGYILLEGGAEFGGEMEAPDRRAIELAGGANVPVGIIPAAAAPANDHLNAGENGVNWFRSLGATDVTALPLTDRKSADNPNVVEALRRGKLIYMLGGSPQHLEQTLAGSASWRAMLLAHEAGAVIGGSSAGAMVLCTHYYDPFQREVLKGLGLISGCCVLPHHNSFGQNWASWLADLLPDTILIGIDERTGMLDDGPDGRWQVYGQGEVTLYRRGKIERVAPGQPFGDKSLKPFKSQDRG